MAPRTTKEQLEVRNLALVSENTALTLPLAFDCALEPARVGIVRVVNGVSDSPSVAYIEVFHFLPWRADGGCVWLREHIPSAERTPKSPRYHITAMSAMNFNHFCDNRALVGQYEWREVQQKVNEAVTRHANAGTTP